MFNLNIENLDTLIKLSQNIVEDPIKIAIKKALLSNCTILMKHEQDEWTGSGFHIGDGYVATAAHVVPAELIGNQYELKITFDGKIYHKSTIIVSNHDTDTAIVYCASIKNNPSVELGDSNKIEKGDIIAVIGSPEGWHDTTTVGRVTNIHQNLGDAAPSPAWQDMIFIDADILEGASGGMVIATDGKVYGIIQGLTGKDAKNYNGVNVVSPINNLKKLMQLYL